KTTNDTACAAGRSSSSCLRQPVDKRMKHDSISHAATYPAFNGTPPRLAYYVPQAAPYAIREGEEDEGRLQAEELRRKTAFCATYFNLLSLSPKRSPSVKLMSSRWLTPVPSPRSRPPRPPRPPP